MAFNNGKNEYKSSRILYIFEAAIEYFISILVTGAYFAKVTTEIGISDNITGILTAFVSLGCGFQLVAIFLANKRPVKRWITALHILNQTFFAAIYLVPFLKISAAQRTAFFIVFLLSGHIINNIVNAPKINWYMSLVENEKRGRFTANKEMVSLIGGILFSFAMSFIIDAFEDKGNLKGAFIVLGITVAVLMSLHTATLFLSKEKPAENAEKMPTGRLIGELIKDKNLLKVIAVSVIWNMANYSAVSFYGTYQIKELGFSMSYVSALAAAYAIVRTAFSRPLGKYADKNSFAKMLNICFVVMLVAFLINVFTIPENGRYFYAAHYVLYAIGMAGINSATINLIYDYVNEEKRVGALALNGSLSGFAGFFTTLAISPLVSHVQNNGNKIFGINAYAQQVVSVLAAVIIVFLLLYLNFVVRKIKVTASGEKAKEKSNSDTKQNESADMN